MKRKSDGVAMMRVLVGTLLCAAILPCLLVAQRQNGQTIAVPLESGGKLIVSNAKFIRTDMFNINQPELSFEIVSEAPGWDSLKLYFAVGGVCKDGPRTWTDSVEIFRDRPKYTHIIQSLIKDYPLQGCRTEVIAARVDSFPVISNEEILHRRTEREAAEAEAKRKAEEAERLEEERAAQADAAEAARRKRLAEQRRKEDAEFAARMERERIATAAREAEEARRVRAACAVIYTRTVDKKVRDLTVREEQQVRACQALGLYPPPSR